MSFLGSLFGGGSSTPQVTFNPTPVANNTGFGVSGGNVTQSPTLQSNIGNLSSTFLGQSTALGSLANTVDPGFSQFRKAGLRDISNTFKSNLSGLKQNLAQRGIAGSSFANSSITNAYATEAQNKADFEASSYIEELNSKFQLIQSQYAAQTQAYSTAITQSNIETATAAQLTASNNQIGASIAEANAQLTAQAQQGAGSFLGSIIGAGASLGGSYMTSQATSALASALLV